MTKKTFNIPLYFGRLTVVCSDDLQKASDLFGLEFQTTGFGALAAERMKDGLKQYMVLFTPKSDLTSLVHESKHIVNMVFRHIGMALDLDNDEAECYFLGGYLKRFIL